MLKYRNIKSMNSSSKQQDYERSDVTDLMDDDHELKIKNTIQVNRD
jgi:hypothetical protein